MSTITAFKNQRSVDSSPTSFGSLSALPALGDPQEKEQFVHRLFDVISPRYDLFNRVSSLGLDRSWRRRTIKSLKLSPGMQVLDLCSGTGDLGREAIHSLLPLGTVAGCDLSYPMLALAQKKLSRDPVAAFHTVQTQARAEGLPFQSESFDAATIGFALRNVSSLAETFKELIRVLKPAGRLGLLEFSKPKNPLLRLGFFIWLMTGIPLAGILLTGRLWPFRYLRRSILQFIPSEEVVAQLGQAGFEAIRAIPLGGGIVTLYEAAKPQ